MIDVTSLTTFKSLVDFITDLNEFFGKNHKPLRLYSRLIDQTTIRHEGPIKKHIEAFKEFCVNNREAISEQKSGKILYPKISYSQHVFINMETIFKHADKDSSDVIWKHILTISALVDPGGKAKQVLKESKNSSSINETNFLSNIIDKVEKNVDINSDPNHAISSILSSGIFTDVIQGMGAGLQNGTLDLGKLMGTVNSLVSTLDSSDPETNQMKTTITNMTAMMSNLDQNNPNSADMTSVLMPMVGSLIGGGLQLPTGGSDIKLESGQTKEESLKHALDEEYQKSKQN